MIKPNMASQWDPRNFKPLDMSKILGYPRRMPPRYEKWLAKFTGSDKKNAKDHMRDFFAFFQLHPVSDDVEDLAMELFSATFHDNARRWYDGLLDARFYIHGSIRRGLLQEIEYQRGSYGFAKQT
jgi:hypothetical protein